MSQCERILDYIKTNGSITTLQAFTDLGVARLASRVHDLRSDGHNIKGDFIEVKNRYGEKCRCMQYTLEES